MKSIKLKKGQTITDKDGNIYLTEKGDTMKIKEAKQYTFDGDTVDSFYDDNKVYKFIEKLIENKVIERRDVRKVAEAIYDYISETYGGVPADRDISDFLEEVMAEDDFRDDIWLPLILQPIIDEYNSAAEFAEEYYTEGDYWVDNDYLVYEGDVSESLRQQYEREDLPKSVENFLEAHSMSEDDFFTYFGEYLTKEKYSLTFEHTNMNSYSDSRSVVTVWSSPMGEYEDVPNDDLVGAFGELDDGDRQYVSRTVDNGYVNERSGSIFINASYDIVNYTVDFDEVEDDFVEYCEKHDYIMNKDFVGYLGFGSEDYIKETAEEKGVEIDWDILNDEMMTFEMSLLGYMKKSKDYYNVMDEGHDRNDDLIIQFTVENSSLLEDYNDLSEPMSFMDSSFTPDKEMYTAMEKIINKSEFLYLCDIRMDIQQA